MSPDLAITLVYVGYALVVLLLFGWQATTGIAIVQKLLSSAASPASPGT